MAKVLVLGGGHRGGGKTRVIAGLLEGSCGVLSVPVAADVEPYTGDDPRVEYVAKCIDFTFDDVRLEDFVDPESGAVSGWDPACIKGSISLQMRPDDSAKFEEFVRSLRKAEEERIQRDIERFVERFREVVGMNADVICMGLGERLERLEMMGAWGQKTVAKPKGKVHTTGRSRAARADRWR